ncbi:MAG: FlxA-like family protein [candidate division NC10 bacterium]|nr:FlxA-like family protein [candidate division NC10 bacterium]
MKRLLMLFVALGVVMIFGGMAVAATLEDLEKQLQDIQKQILQMKEEKQRQDQKLREVEAAQAAQKEEVKREAASLREQARRVSSELAERVKIGGYGSVRFESNSLKEQSSTFTFRRFVLTADAKPADPMRVYLELEFERFTQLELERTTRPEAGGLRVSEAIEGTDGSEISIEQLWFQYDLYPWLKFRTGQVLVPRGRFNINHDDNRWNIARRSLVDRGVPVLPVKAAWPELGAGFLGDIPLGEMGKLTYQAYVINGVALDAEVEKVVQARRKDTQKLELEAEFRPSRGTAKLDVKDSKAVATRIAWSPFPGQEIGGSFYYGRYTPKFLSDESLIAFAVDGLTTIGPFEIEAEYVNTNFRNIDRVARSFAQVAVKKEAENESIDGGLEAEVEFGLAGLARNKHGYWIEGRYRFWPEFLTPTIFGKYFENPQLIAILRGEQVWLNGLVREAEFENGVLTNLEQENRQLYRVTAGLAYRPTPLVVFQLAYEYTKTDRGRSLAEVTNFLTAQGSEDDAHAVLVGVAFGF